MKKENIQFRILYFIGIVLIVAGHCGGGSVSLFYEWFPIYSFQIALFVFCSGYFFIKNKDLGFIQFVKKLFIKFIIPLYVWNLVYGLIILLLHHFGFKFGEDISFKALLLLPIYNGHQFTFNLATWFIPPLLITQFINYFSIKIISNKNKFYIIHFIISLLLGFLGVIISMKGYNAEWGILLCRTLYFIPFFSLGILYKTVLEKYDELSNIIYFMVLFFITLIIIFIFGGLKTYAPSWCADFDNFYRPFIVGILGILFWLRVSKILVPALQNSRIIKYVSKNTYSIMIHHFMGFFILNTIWFVLSKIFSFIDHFNISAYKTSVQYMYLPKELIQFKLLYLLFGIGFSLLVAFIVNKTKQFIKNKIKKAN